MSDITSTAQYYVVEGYWTDGYSIDSPQQTASITAPVTVQQVIPSYLYWEYSDDSDLQAFVASYNALAQQILNTFNQLNMPVYAGNALIVGPLLDWIANGIYGVPRPVLSSGSVSATGTYNSYPFNQGVIPYDDLVALGTVTQIVTSDDIFKRILTWNLYRGDGKIFSITWLKRRVLRFLNGLDGTDPGIDQTYLVSVTCANRTFTINLSDYVTAQPSSTLPATLQAAMQSGVLNVPFQYTFTVNT
jgi:hypothetical protein